MNSSKKSKINIAILCTSLNVLGGLSHHISQIYLNIDKDRFDPIIIYSSKSRKSIEEFFLEREIPSSKIIFLEPSSKFMFCKLIFSLRRMLKTHKIDILHTFMLHSDIIGFASSIFLGLKARISSVEGKFILDETNGVGRPKQFIYKLLNFLIRPFFALTITVSDSLKIEVVQNSMHPKIKTMPVGIELTANVDVLERDEETSVIACMSQFSKDKGIEYFIKAIPIIKQSIKDASFIIAGSGDEENNLKALVNELDISGKVYFPGWINDKKDFFRKVDIFVMPSLREGCPLGLLEAMSYKKPVVAFDVPGINEILVDGENGILIEPFDINSFAQAVARLCTDIELSKALGENAKNCIADKFSVRREMQSIEKEYLNVCG